MTCPLRRSALLTTGAGVIAGCLIAAQPLPAADSTSSDNKTSSVGALPELLLSRQLRDRIGVQVGDIVTLATAAVGADAVRFKVVGTYEPTPDPTHFTVKRMEARLHLPDLLALTADTTDPQALESVSALNVALVKPTDAEAVRAGVTARMPGLSVRPTTRTSDGTDLFGVLDRFHRAIAVVTVVGSTAFLLALMMMRAEERREIVGSLRLIGISSRTILGEVFVEGLLIAVAGGLFGVALAAGAQGLVNRFFQWQYDTPLVFMRVTPSIAWRSVAFAVPLGVFAGLAASWALLRQTAGSLVRR